MPRKKKEPIHVAKSVLLDDSGMLVEQDYFMQGPQDVKCQTQLHLGAQPLACAGVSLVSADALLEIAEAPKELRDQVMMCLKQVHALIGVRLQEENQKRLDRRDRGVSDDWPNIQSNGDLPF